MYGHKYSQSLVATRRQLLARGYTPRSLAAAVHSGRLIRVRRGHYAVPETDESTQRAVRVGGLLTCISAARLCGIWVAEESAPHIYLPHGASRLRSPRNRFARLTEDNREGCVLHWIPLVSDTEVTMDSVGPVNALAHLIRCQPRHLAIAALDSAVYQGVVRESQLDAVFAAVPLRFHFYRAQVDQRAMSGLETLVRLLVRDAGLTCTPQFHFPGIGTVDLLVEECIVIETDGRRGHADPVGTARDYDRDVALAALSYVVLRFNFSQVMRSPEVVLSAVHGALAARGIRTSHVHYPST